jgi:putative ABC transport system permease protein
MISLRYWPVVFKQVLRHRTRTLLTVSGVAIAMFLFVTVQTLQSSVDEATEVNAADQLLIVYRDNRFCPATSRLPEHYGNRIEKIGGVASVIPMKIVVTNCAASLDVVTFRGLPSSRFEEVANDWKVVGGTTQDWLRRFDSAFVGKHLAMRRDLHVGQAFVAAGVTVTVAGIFQSPKAEEQDVAYVHLDFLQQSAAQSALGIVTQFNVTVSEPALLYSVAKAIDEEFRNEAEPTQTRPERAFVAQAGSDMVNIVRFTRILGWACLAAVLALVANAIILSVQDRIKEHAVLQTLGFRGSLIARLITLEGVIIGVTGGMIGTLAALAIIHYGNFSLHSEGRSIAIIANATMILWGMIISSSVGVLAGLVPAWQASRREIAQCFRAV